MVKDTKNSSLLSKQSSSEEKESFLNYDEEEDENVEGKYGQKKEEKVNKNIKKEEKSLRGRPKDNKTANGTEPVIPKQNFDQDNLNCIFFKYRLDVMSTDTRRGKFYDDQKNSPAEQHLKDGDNSNQEREDNGTEKKIKRRQKTKEELQSELRVEYQQKKYKKIKESNRQKSDQQASLQYYNDAFKPLDQQLDRRLTEIEQLMVDSTTQFKKIFEGFYSDNFAQMKNEYGLLDELVINIFNDQAASNSNIESKAERSGCTVIPPSFWKFIADTFLDTFNQRLSNYSKAFE